MVDMSIRSAGYGMTERCKVCDAYSEWSGCTEPGGVGRCLGGLPSCRGKAAEPEKGGPCIRGEKPLAQQDWKGFPIKGCGDMPHRITALSRQLRGPQ